MEFIGDFHIHSRFARACSKDITLDKLEYYAKIKGLNILGTGDFTHPTHFKEISSMLTEDENGILWSKNKFPFIWQTEISLMYTHNKKGRRIHHLVLAPNKEVVQQITKFLGKKGRLDYDGRPIFGISSIEFVESLINISKDIEIIPAHSWTPFFGILGSKSGYDSVDECFEEKAKYIHAIETGMSSDPPLNWRVSSLDKYNLVSFSDIHSYWPWRIGREATIFDCKIAYKDIINAIRTGQDLKGTIETVPDYGRYHIDGHRNCNISLYPQESKELKGICPKCKRPLTLGVAYRVEELADRPKETIRKNAPKYYEIIPLTELIAAVYNIKQLHSKKVWEIYNKLIKHFNSEFNILLNISEQDLLKVIDKKLADIIIKNRENKLKIKPGYDGVYGEIILEDAQKASSAQKSIAQF